MAKLSIEFSRYLRAPFKTVPSGNRLCSLPVFNCGIQEIKCGNSVLLILKSSVLKVGRWKETLLKKTKHVTCWNSINKINLLHNNLSNISHIASQYTTKSLSNQFTQFIMQELSEIFLVLHVCPILMSSWVECNLNNMWRELKHNLQWFSFLGRTES